MNTRYYDPITGRFINADKLIDDRGVTTQNMFAYCLNNPINMSDECGQLAKWLKSLVDGVVDGFVGTFTGIVDAVKDPVGTVKSVVSDPWGTIKYSLGKAADPFNGKAIAYNMIKGNHYEAGKLYGENLGTAIMVGASAGAGKAVKAIKAPPKNPGVAFKSGQPGVQYGVDPNTLTVNKHAINSTKYKLAKSRIETQGMYGRIDVNRNGFVLDGNHRTIIGQKEGIAVDVFVE